jgi:hypothetical protein
LSINNDAPVNVVKPRMLLDVLGVTWATSESLSRVAVQKQKNETLGTLRHVVGDFQGSGLNVFEKLFLFSVEIWWHTDEHFVNQNTKEIPIDTLSVALFTQHFRGEIGN